MPVILKPITHLANPVLKPPLQNPKTALLKACLQDKSDEVSEILETSFYDLDETPIYPSRNGFVQAAIDAYSHHQHLRLGPEDIWFTILTQLFKYINANAKELRSKFVDHTGQIELEIIAEADLSEIAVMMGSMIQENTKDASFKEWIMPNFSTTTKTDIVVASTIMMAQLQKYFLYAFDPISCGLPSVALRGEKSDWEEIGRRLENLSGFGKEPTRCGWALQSQL